MTAQHFCSTALPMSHWDGRCAIRTLRQRSLISAIWTRWPGLSPALRRTGKARAEKQICRSEGRTRYRNLSRRFSRSGPKPLLHLLVVNKPGLLDQRPAAMEDGKIGNAPNLKSCRQFGIALRINLYHYRLSCHISGRTGRSEEHT